MLKKGSTDKFQNVNIEPLLSKNKTWKSKERTKLCEKKLEWSKSHSTPNPRISAILNDTPNSKTKHQIAAAGWKSVSAEIRKKLLLCNILTAELSVVVDATRKT